MFHKNYSSNLVFRHPSNWPLVQMLRLFDPFGTPGIILFLISKNKINSPNQVLVGRLLQFGRVRAHKKL